MLNLLPRRALFQFEIAIQRMPRLPRADGDPGKWTDRFLVPPLPELDDESVFADVYWAWHEDGFAAAFDVRQPRPLRSDPEQWWKRDGLRLCVDTRDTRDLKRATRFCHFFYLLPTGGGTNHKQPIVGFHRMSKAKDVPPKPDLSLIQTQVRVQRGGYFQEVVIPASCLNGWDPAAHPRIGVFYKVKRDDGASQHLTVTDELGWNSDPSTWAVGVLTG